MASAVQDKTGVTFGAGLSPIKTTKAEHTVVQPTTVTQEQILGDEDLQLLTMKIRSQVEADFRSRIDDFYSDSEKKGPSPESILNLTSMAGDAAQMALKENFTNDALPTIMTKITSLIETVRREATVTAAHPLHEEEPEHFRVLATVTQELAVQNKDLESTRKILQKLAAEKKRLTASLRQQMHERFAASTTDDGDDDHNDTKVDEEIGKLDGRIKTFEGMEAMMKSNIKSVLAEHYNTPDGGWNQESKTLKPVKLDIKLAGKADPKLVESLVVTVRTLLHDHVSRFWAIIPYFECIVANREQTKHWDFPCEQNNYRGLPTDLTAIYMSQSKTLFQHLWAATSGNTQVGSTIIRKTYGEKFLGDNINAGESVKSSQNDGMMSVYYLITTHESAGYEEKARLRHTLHHTSAMFVTGNPQQRLPAIRLVLDKALSLQVRIDYEATVKPIVTTLRKRSPNFNELANKYLQPIHVMDWDEQGLLIFDRLLSEIDHVIDSLGMTSLQDLRDTKSRQHEASAKVAYAFYTGANERSDGATQRDLPRKFQCNNKCAASKCNANIEPDKVDAVNEYRAKQYKQRGDKANFRPVLCNQCVTKITTGDTTSLPGPDGSRFERSERNGKVSYRHTPKGKKTTAAKTTAKPKKEKAAAVDAETLELIRQFVAGKTVTNVVASTNDEQSTGIMDSAPSVSGQDQSGNQMTAGSTTTQSTPSDETVKLHEQLQRLGIIHQ